MHLEQGGSANEQIIVPGIVFLQIRVQLNYIVHSSCLRHIIIFYELLFFSPHTSAVLGIA